MGAMPFDSYEKIEKAKLEELTTKRDLAEAKADLIRWVIGAGFLQTALIVGLILRLTGNG
jgi:hypothetical protein